MPIVLRGIVHFSRRESGMQLSTSIEYVRAWLGMRVQSEAGASLVEYALLVALIAVVCVGAVTFIGSSASGKLSSVGSSLQ